MANKFAQVHQLLRPKSTMLGSFDLIGYALHKLGFQITTVQPNEGIHALTDKIICCRTNILARLAQLDPKHGTERSHGSDVTTGYAPRPRVRTSSAEVSK
jgi:hypothetical protein